MSIYVRAFKKEDFDVIDPIEEIIGDFDPDMAQAIEDSSLAITAIRNGEVVACGGTHPIDEFQCEGWIRLDKKCREFPIEILRWIKEGVKIIEETSPFEQVNANVKSGFNVCIRMLESMGFSKRQEIEDDGEIWCIYSKRTKYEIPCITA